MKKTLLLVALTTLLAGLSGCLTPPEVVVEAPLTLQDLFQIQAERIMMAGGLATVGAAKSESLPIALNQAKAQGRRKLALQLGTRMEELRTAFSKETGLTKKDPLLISFGHAAETITGQYIPTLVASELKHETTNGMVTACALMKLDPGIIVTQLTEDRELSDRFLNSQAYKTLEQEIKTYNARPAE